MPEDYLKKLAERTAKMSQDQVFHKTDTITQMYGGVGYPQANMPKRYKAIGAREGWSAYALPEDIEYEAALAQTGFEAFVNTGAGFWTQALAGVVDSVAAWDVKGVYDMAVGNAEEEYGNWLNKIGEKIRDYSNDNHQIYQKGDSLWSSRYWAQQAQSLGYTGGIIAEMLAEQALLATLTGGTGNAVGLASKMRLLKMGGQAAFGMGKGIQEGYMNGLETMQQTYHTFKDKGYSDEEAAKLANKAATLGFRAEVGPLAALNAIQFMNTFGMAKTAFGKATAMNQGFSGGFETLAGALVPSVTNKYGKAAIGLGINAVSEGFEEGIQAAAGKYAEHTVLKEEGYNVGNTKFFDDKEMRDSIIGGILGGFLMSGAGKVMNKYRSGIDGAKQYSEAYDAFGDTLYTRFSEAFAKQDEIATRFQNTLEEYRKNPTKENQAKFAAVSLEVQQAQTNDHLNNTVSALQFDYIQGNTTAFEAHVEQMQVLLDAVNNKDIDTLKKHGLVDALNNERFEGSFKKIQDTFAENIANSYSLKEKLENNLLNTTSDFDLAFDIAKEEFYNEKNLNKAEAFKQDLETLFATDPQFKQMSENGKKRFRLEAERDAINSLAKTSPLDIQRKKEINKELEELDKYSVIDQRLAMTINPAPVIKGYTSAASLNQAIDDTNAKLEKLRNPKVIKQKLEERSKKKVKKAKTKEAVEEAVREAVADNVNTPSVLSEAEARKEQLQREEVLKQINPVRGEVKPKEKVEELSEKATEANEIAKDTLEALIKSGVIQTGVIAQQEAEESGQDVGNEEVPVGLPSEETFAEEEEQAFSPREFKEDEMSPEVKENLKNLFEVVAKQLDEKLGREANFEDLIRSQIEQFGYEKTEELFEGLKFAWASIGRDISNAQEVYNTFFNASQQAMAILSGYLGNEMAAQTNVEGAKGAVVKGSKTSKFDKDNRPVDRDGNYTTDGRTSISSPKAAYLGIRYMDITNEDGTISRVPVVAALNKAEEGTNNNVLNYNIIKPGTELEVGIPEDVDSVKVADWIFNPETNKLESVEMTFGEWRAKYKAEPGSVAYNSKVPIVASINGEFGFYIHDTGWYNVNNVTGKTAEDQKHNIKSGIEQVMSVREDIIEGGQTTIQIDERKFGSIFRISDLIENNEPVSLSEATGQTKLAIAGTRDSVSDSNGPLGDKFPLVNNLEKNALHQGAIYELREVTEGQFLASIAFRNDIGQNEPINDIAYNNTKFSTIASIILNAKGDQQVLQIIEKAYGISLEKAREIQSAILKTTGIDITHNLGEYINMFTVVSEAKDMVAKLENNNVNENGESIYPTGTNYISFQNKVLKIVNKDGGPVPRNPKNGFDTLPGINLNAVSPKTLASIMKALDLQFKEGVGNFRNSWMNASTKQLGKNAKLTVLSETGSVLEYDANKHGENTYEGYLKDHLKTNIKSFAIKDAEGNTTWVTDIQPMIYYSVKKEAGEDTGNAEEEAPKDPVVIAKAKAAATAVVKGMNNTSGVVTIEEAKAQLPPALREYMEENFFLGGNIDDMNFSRRELDAVMSAALDEIGSNQISSLSPLEQSKLVASIFNKILSATDTSEGTLSLRDISERIESSLETFLQPQIDKLIDMRDQLVALNNPNLAVLIIDFQGQIDKLQTVIEEKDKLISKGLKEGEAKGDIYQKMERFLAEELTKDEDIAENENGEIENDFTKSPLEKDVKVSFSNNLKIFFSNIERQNPKTKGAIKNFSYLEDFIDVDDAIHALAGLMVGLPSSIQSLIDILETKKSDPVYNQILNKLKNAPEDVQNEILYKMIQSKLDMHMVLYSYDAKTKSYSLKVLNANSSAQDIRLKEQWKSNFRNSQAFKTIEEEREYNKEGIQKIAESIEPLMELKKIDETHFAQVQSVFEAIGIEVSDNTIAAYIEQHGNNMTAKGGILKVFKDSMGLILADIEQKEKGVEQKKDGSLVEMNPYEVGSGVIESLIDLEIDLNGSELSKSFRVAGKTIQGAVQKMMVYDIKEQLKDPESPFFKALKELPYSQGNYILHLLENNPKFRDNFDVSFVSLEAMKQNRQKSFGDRKINKLANTDNMLTQYAFFQNTMRTIAGTYPGTNLKFRMGQMFNPALSDKEQMILYSTAVLDLDYTNFGIAEGKVTLNQDVISFLTDQLFMSEFDRIVDTYKNPSTVKNYDGAAKRFLVIPELNNLELQGSNIHSLIEGAIEGQDVDTTIEGLKANFKEQAEKVIEATMMAEMKSKIDLDKNEGEWFDAGFTSVDEKGVFSLDYFDAKYLSNKRNKNQNITKKEIAQIAALDLIVNQFLNQNNTYQLIAGDLALYAPNVNNFTTDGVVNNVEFSKAIGENISKRMAMLIAPGNKLANSQGDSYLQLFVNDPVKITSTSRSYLAQFYGEVTPENETLIKSLENVEQTIENLYERGRERISFNEILDRLETRAKNIRKALKDNNPEIAGYFDIEGTDAQEYTTWKEHMDILFRQGRLSVQEKEVLQTAYAKLENGQELNPEELLVVMNPIKPVYTGNHIDRDANGKPTLNRVVYIKSSSFPLLPQLTKEFKLDAIRRNMEALQSSTGKNVRLSYQSANKVGALISDLTVRDLYSTPFEELSEKLTKSALTLDRNNFRIQQDTPYKTDKFLANNEEDQTTLGSQMWKVLLGSGVNKIKENVFPQLFGKELIGVINEALVKDGVAPITVGGNKMISGIALDKIKFHVEKMYFETQKTLLYEELGFDQETRSPIDTAETIKLVHKLLDRETSTRQYPEGIVESLEIIPNKGELEFLLPLWLSNGSNKFESLLQSIITNRLIKISLPGNQHISTSSEGFERVSSLDQLSNDVKSGIVWFNPNHTGELKPTTLENGKLVEAEILVQSKFRKTTVDKTGKKTTTLIDLSKAPYSKMVNGQLVLDMSLMDEELLSSFSFRIPTSAHQSGAILKVVGFLPEQSGDMLVVPKEHTQQIGEDFDIDKRTLYKSNYEIDAKGGIRKLNYSENHPRVKGKTDTESLKFKLKMLENAMVDVYKSVYSSTDPAVQRNISKILSFDEATKTAGLIYDRINSSKDDKYFSIFSDTYQRQQMKLGADGKTGIGVHSNAVTFQAQMERLDNRIQVQTPIYEKGEIVGFEPVSITIGPKAINTSHGVLGLINTMDGTRSIGDIHTENQNSSTDNIKAQIMGKRNENSHTMNVLVQLAYRGFDLVPFNNPDPKGPKTVQIGSLFIAQPILRRYVELKEQAGSITADFQDKSEASIIKRLLEEFNIDNHPIIVGEDGTIDKTDFLTDMVYTEASEKMTGNRLYDNLLNEKDTKRWDSDIQLAVLQKFFILSEEAEALGQYQSLINLSTSGLGISYFNVLDRIETLNKLGAENRFANVQSLVGEFILEDEFDLVGEEAKEYTLIGDYYIKPTTTEGTVLIQALSSADDIMQTMFPYKEAYIKDTVNKIIENKGKDLGKKQRLELQYKVVREMKDYMYAVNDLGLFEGDINLERERLFFDTKENTSLATYLKSISKDPLFKSNTLLKSLLLDKINSDGSPSIIVNQTDYGNNFDKTDKYNAFLELLKDDTSDLGTYNGEQMTPRKLAQDLASYAFLANNENGAIGFRDFISPKFLETTGVAGVIRDINKSRNNRDIEIIMGNFEKQFYQHNPEEATIFSASNINLDSFGIVNPEAGGLLIASKKDSTKISAFLGKLTEFKYSKDIGPIAIRDTSIKLSDNKFKLFIYDGDSYKRVPVLGTFGYNEYNPSSSHVVSAIYPTVATSPVVVKPKRRSGVGTEVKPTIEDFIDLSRGVEGIVEQLQNSNNSRYRAFAEQIMPHLDPTTKIKIEAKVLKNGKVARSGMYENSTNTIYINPNIIENIVLHEGEVLSEVLEEIILEEVIHSITINEMLKFGKREGNVYTPNENAPVFITKLAKLYEIAQEKFPYVPGNTENYYTKDIFEFVAGVFVSESFRAKLDSATDGKKTLLDKFKEALSSMIKFLNGSSYSDTSVDAVFELLKNKTEVAPNQEPLVLSIYDSLLQMKERDTVIEQEILKIEGFSRPIIVDKVDVRKFKEFSQEEANKLIKMFDMGIAIMVHPPEKRKHLTSKEGIAERLYMAALIKHIDANLLPGQATKDGLTIENVNALTQRITKNSYGVLGERILPPIIQDNIAGNENIDTILEKIDDNGSLINLTSDEIYYEHAMTGVKYQRVTSYIDTLGKQGRFKVTPNRAVDAKARTKGAISNKYIGFTEGIQGSSTESYAMQANFQGVPVNNGAYERGDVVFVSVVGKRGAFSSRATEYAKTIEEAKLALNQGATLVTDTVGYIHTVNPQTILPYDMSLEDFENYKGVYNSGEKALYNALKEEGYRYSEQIIDGVTVGIWNEPASKILESAQTIGTKTDTLVRDFFAGELQDLNSYELGDQSMVENFLKDLQTIKDRIEANGERIIANDILLHNDALGIAGTIDLLSVSKNGTVKIYDMKTMRGNNFAESYPGETVSKYDSTKYGKSKRQSHSEQLSLYNILLSQTYGISATSIAIMPIEIAYEGGDVTTSKMNLLPGVHLEKLDSVKGAKLNENARPTLKDSVEKVTETLLESAEQDFATNTGIQAAIYDTLGVIDQTINQEDITYTEEDGTLCAEVGGKTGFTPGGNWSVMKDFKGASHARGGINIEIGGGKIKMTGKEGKIEAEFGLVLPKNSIYEG